MGVVSVIIIVFLAREDMIVQLKNSYNKSVSSTLFIQITPQIATG